MLGGAGAASASLPSPDSVRPGKNITVFHNIDFVAAFGHSVGEDVQVDVIRSGHRIATARGAAAATDEGGALEVNHGPEGAPLPGDCWEGATPDVRPGDHIRVTTEGGTDEVIVDDLMIESMTREAGLNGVVEAANNDASDDEVWVRGYARSGVDGSPIPVERLDSAEFRDTINNQLRLVPNEVVADATRTDGGWIAKYRAPFNFVKDPQSVSQTLAALVRDGHGMGFGHTEVLPPDTMLVEGAGSANGPAGGCEVSPALATSVGTVSEDELVVAKTEGLGDDDAALTVAGWAEASLDAAEVEVRDETGATVVKPVAGLVAGATAQQGWGATLTKGELAGLGQGELTVRLLVGGTATGVAKTVLYDTVAPVISVTPEPGSYERSQEVEVTGDEPVTYRLDGAPARGYDDPIEIGQGVHTLELRSEDAAGNVTTRTLEYRIDAPPVTQPDPAPAQPQTRAQTAAPATALTPALSTPKVLPAGVVKTKAPVARMLRGKTRITLSQARRRGVPVAFEAPAGARSATVRAYRTVRGKLRLAATKVLRVKAGRNAATLRSSAIRPGALTVKVILRDADGKAGRASSITVRVVR
jgi:hypothetical protein